MRFRKKMGGGEVDPLIPIMNLVCMLIPLLIFGAVFVRYNTVEVRAPAPTRNTGESEEDALQLRVLITKRGFHFRVNPVHLRSWMVQAFERGAETPDIPVKSTGYDYDALTARLTELKGQFKGEQQLVLGAEDDVAYDVLIQVMDAARGKGKGLFPEVVLTRNLS